VITEDMNDEIKELANSFNEMADRITEINNNLQQEIIDHKKAKVIASNSEKKFLRKQTIFSNVTKDSKHTHKQKHKLSNLLVKNENLEEKVV
jgi:nitrate/nitrite-specific signal transduction histidine kinase